MAGDTRDPGVERPRVQRTRVAAYALCRDEAGQILLVRYAPYIVDTGLWTLPGGGLEFGESPAAAVLRELTEETGLTGEVDALIDVVDRVLDASDGARLHSIRLVYRVRITGGELRDEVDGSTDRCAWFEVEEARRLHLDGLASHVLATWVDGPAGA